jgi:allantoicase
MPLALPSAGAIIIQAVPEKIALAEQLIGTFDQEQTSASAIQVVQQENAQAITLAQAVNSALEERQGDGVLPAYGRNRFRLHPGRQTAMHQEPASERQHDKGRKHHQIDLCANGF